MVELGRLSGIERVGLAAVLLARATKIVAPRVLCVADLGGVIRHDVKFGIDQHFFVARLGDGRVTRFIVADGCNVLAGWSHYWIPPIASAIGYSARRSASGR